MIGVRGLPAESMTMMPEAKASKAMASMDFLPPRALRAAWKSARRRMETSISARSPSKRVAKGAGAVGRGRWYLKRGALTGEEPTSRVRVSMRGSVGAGGGIEKKRGAQGVRLY